MRLAAAGIARHEIDRVIAKEPAFPTLAGERDVAASPLRIAARLPARAFADLPFLANRGKHGALIGRALGRCSCAIADAITSRAAVA